MRTIWRGAVSPAVSDAGGMDGDDAHAATVPAMVVATTPAMRSEERERISSLREQMGAMRACVRVQGGVCTETVVRSEGVCSVHLVGRRWCVGSC